MFLQDLKGGRHSSSRPEIDVCGVQVVSSGLEEESCPFVDYDECLTPAELLLPRSRQPKPGEPQVQSPLRGTHSVPPPPHQVLPCFPPSYLCYSALLMCSTLAYSFHGHC